MTKMKKRKPLRFDLLTIFPGMFDCYLNESMIKRAKERKLLDVRAHDLREWATTKHRQVDDRLFGGGAGMLLKVEPIYRALKSLKALKGAKKSRVILMSPAGKPFGQKDAKRLAAYDRLVMICGRYEGVDHRVTEKLVDEELSIGDYVLTGGELPAMVILDAVARHVPGVVGKAESVVHESHSEPGYLEHPQYTRPEVFSPKKGLKWAVPEVLLSGDHKKVAEWRKANARRRKA